MLFFQFNQNKINQIAQMLSERERSWIMLLIYNEECNHLYLNNFNFIKTILDPLYNIKILSLHHMGLEYLNSDELDILCIELSKCQQLTKLDLTNNGIGNLDPRLFQKLIGSIKKCHNLQYLYLSDNNLSIAQMDYIVQNTPIGNIEFGVANTTIVDLSMQYQM